VESFDKVSMKAINFNYFRNDELINVKFRPREKKFKLISNAELIFYNLDSIRDTTDCIITEGEFDCLAWIEAGFNNVVSVPNGANKGQNNLQYIDNCYEYFENKEKIYLATDNDENGKKLAEDLVKRFGFEKCFLINFKDVKDSNDYLIKYGKKALLDTLGNAKEIKIAGLFSVMDFEDGLDDLYFHGLSSGLKINYELLDTFVTWQTGRLAIITGIPGHGKSEFLDEIINRLNILHGWKACYFTPENYPLELHTSKIISKITGQEFNVNAISSDEYRDAKLYVYQNYSYIYPTDENFNLDSIFERAKYQILKHGIKILVIDPWNRLEHQIQGRESETNYISRNLDKLTNFAQKRDVLVFVIAHPRKMEKKNGIYEVPNLYDINGSANWFNKCDYGITVYRVFGEQKVTQVHIQKVKFKHLGNPGLSEFAYDFINGRYFEINGKSYSDFNFDRTNWLNKPIIKEMANKELEESFCINNSPIPF
jgi:twinkle protein